MVKPIDGESESYLFYVVLNRKTGMSDLLIVSIAEINRLKVFDFYPLTS